MIKNVLFFFFTLIGTTAIGQNLDRLYKDGLAKFFAEDFVLARERFEEIIRSEPSFKDSKYRLEICELLTNARNRPLDNFLAYGKTSGRTDKFYNYWLGLVYYDKYEFRKAIAAWKRFLGRRLIKAQK